MTAIQQADGTRGHAHKMIVELAKQMAAELYDDLMKDNKRWAAWKETLTREFAIAGAEQIQLMFIEQMYVHQIEPARATLAGLLATPIDEELKASIADALIADAPLREGRLRAAKGRLARLGYIGRG